MSFELTDLSTLSKPQRYVEMNRALLHLTDGEPDVLAQLANAASLLFYSLERINWAGFYLYKNQELIVGPFQGKPACTHIALGRGVCGTAAATRQTIVVKNVHDFAGHIACDSASQSEIVIPLMRDDRLLGVLDIDSPDINRFDSEDQAGLEGCVQTLLKTTLIEKLLG